MALEIQNNSIVINGETVPLAKRPKYTRGEPKIEVRTAQIGNNTVYTQSKDFTEAIGKVVIALRHTKENLLLIQSWQEKIGKNTILIMDNDVGETITFKEMSVEEDIEYDFDAEETEVTFVGSRGA